ncbi:hypothetical protein BD769DRAFT_637303 [Suillus cothurnatus]|nr:hypothetical protein BD769DRAFT_637303 [Suillus cothurnatus]
MLLLTGLSQVVITAESKSVSVGPRNSYLIISRGRDYRRTLIVKRKVSACQCCKYYYWESNLAIQSLILTLISARTSCIIT